MDEEVAAATAAAAAMLRAWLAGDQAAEQDEAMSATAVSDACSCDSSSIHLPAPPIQLLHPVPSFQVRGQPRGSASSQRPESPGVNVPLLDLTSLNGGSAHCGVDNSGPLQSCSQLQGSAGGHQGSTLLLSGGQNHAARSTPACLTHPTAVPPPAVQKSHTGAAAAAVCRATRPARSVYSPRMQRRLLVSAAFQDPSHRPPAPQRTPRRSCISADRRVSAEAEDSGPSRRGSSQATAETETPETGVDALPAPGLPSRAAAMRRVYVHGASMQHAAAAASSRRRRHIWATDAV